MAICANSMNSSSSKPPASHNNPSPMTGNGNSKVPNRANGTTASPTQGTASRLASGPLALTGNPSASSSGNKPTAIAHCARPSVCHHGHAPKRPPKIRISNATAPKDNQKPGCKLAKGSNSRTTTNASSTGSQAPKWRNRQRQSNTRPTITQARLTGTSKPANNP
ncbi:hypothetical protein D9M68_808020 [compost metagenome]